MDLFCSVIPLTLRQAQGEEIGKILMLSLSKHEGREKRGKRHSRPSKTQA
jgi:hypothetical protein